MKKIAINLVDVGKKFTIYHEKPTLVENILQMKAREEFWALRNINLTILKGEKVGIIGPNGSGKTTLLEIISRITTPTSGSLMTDGRIVSLIELKSGFHPDLTGEENINLNGLLIGMNKKEIENNFSKIIEFANIGNFIDAPFYTFSAGMALRLGFSIAIHANPDILILDEIYEVGDEDFRKKSENILEELFKKRKTIIMVSHWEEFLRKRCNRVIHLREGKIIKDEKN